MPSGLTLDALVKPLEWKPWKFGQSEAASCFGPYHTWGGHWRGPGMEAGRFAIDPEAAAEADYTARILAALDLDAIAALGRQAEAMREAAAQVAEHYRDMCGECHWPEEAVLVGSNVANDIMVAIRALPLPAPAPVAELQRSALDAIEALHREACRNLEAVPDSALAQGYEAGLQRAMMILRGYGDAASDPVAEAYREGWRFAYRQCEATGSVPNPDYSALASQEPRHEE